MIPFLAQALSQQATNEGSDECCVDYLDPGLKIVEYERSFEQNEILV